MSSLVMIENIHHMRLPETYRLFENLSYPITTDELLEEIGDQTLDLSNGEETVKDVFDRIGTVELKDPTDAHNTFMSALSTMAIGRKAYSDRDAPVQGLADRDPRAMNELLEPETRFKTEGPHCGICEHVEVVGDWDPMAFCRKLERTIDPVEIGEVCENYRQMAR